MHQRNDNAVLYEKMQAEQEQYKEKLLGLPPSELLAKAFEYTWREEVLMSLSGSGLTPARARALSRLDCPLDACYQEWLSADCDYLASLRESIEHRADAAIREHRNKAGRESR